MTLQEVISELEDFEFIQESTICSFERLIKLNHY